MTFNKTPGKHRGTDLSTQVCARDGCNRKVSRIALLHGDLHCSRRCFEVDHGILAATEADEQHRLSEVFAGHARRTQKASK